MMKHFILNIQETEGNNCTYSEDIRMHLHIMPELHVDMAISAYFL